MNKLNAKANVLRVKYAMDRIGKKQFEKLGRTLERAFSSFNVKFFVVESSALLRRAFML